MNCLTVKKTFGKKERISCHKEIELLFKNGSSFTIPPLCIIFLEKGIDLKTPSAILISVPKKIYKQAVKRNKIKRWIRETYRINKHILLKFLIKKNKTLRIAFIYIKKESYCHNDVKVGVIKALHFLIKKISC